MQKEELCWTEYLAAFLDSESLFLRSLGEAIARQADGDDMKAGVFWGRLRQQREKFSDFDEASRP